jgi:hypothetical protein
VLSQEPYLSLQVRLGYSQTNIYISSSASAGIKPAIAAATVVAGMAGIWSYVKKSV